MFRVLVTGAGGIYGEAIIRSLKASALAPFVLAVDCQANASGFFVADQSEVVPKVRCDSYLEVIGELSRRHRIDIIFIASGVEMPVLTHQREVLEELCGAFVVLNSPELMTITEDKWQTCKFLQDHGLAAPESTISDVPEALSQFAAKVGFPIVAKPRTGDGSRDLSICEDEETLLKVMTTGSNMIAQQHLGNVDSEYTVGVLGTEEGKILGSIAFRRLLGMFGRTVYAEVVDHPGIRNYAESIASLLKPRGYCNVQLRLHEGKPVAFEINGRVSSSTGFRTTAGFNEAEILIRHYLLKEPIPRFMPRAMRLVRVHQELILPDSEGT